MFPRSSAQPWHSVEVEDSAYGALLYSPGWVSKCFLFPNIKQSHDTIRISVKDAENSQSYVESAYLPSVMWKIPALEPVVLL